MPATEVSSCDSLTFHFHYSGNVHAVTCSPSEIIGERVKSVLDIDSLFWLKGLPAQSIWINNNSPFEILQWTKEIEVIKERKLKKIEMRNFTDISQLTYFNIRCQNQVFILIQKLDVVNVCVAAHKNESLHDALMKDGRFKPGYIDRFILTVCDSVAARVDTKELVQLHEHKLFAVSLNTRKRFKRERTLDASVSENTVGAVHTGGSAETSRVCESQKDDIESGLQKSNSQWLQDTHVQRKKQAEKELGCNLQRAKILEKLHGKVSNHISDSMIDHVYLRKKQVAIVGLGKAKSKIGTCFHLNDGYIMTCYHVIDGALSQIEISFSRAIHTPCVKDIADNIYVCFDYVSYDKEPTWMELDGIVYSYCATQKSKRFDDNLDFVILKLADEKVPDISLNPESVPFGGLCEDGEPKGKVALIGHPGGGLREIDFTDIVPSVKRDEMQRNKCPRKYGTDLYGYKDFRSVERVTYDTSFFHGASGSPVINTSGKLVAMHKSGLLLAQGKTVHYLLEIGVQIRAIINYVRKHNPELLSTCFPGQDDFQPEPMDES